MEVGDISKPFVMIDQMKNKKVVAIVRLKNRIPGHKANLSDDFQTIKSLLEEQRRQETIQQWIAQKQSDTYVSIKEGWRNCEFKYDGWIKK